MLSVQGDVVRALRFTERLSRQMPFAVASALTATVREVASAMPAEVQEAAQGGAVPFTRAGFYSQAATKQRLTAVVGIKRLQAQYLACQVLGGERQPRRVALRLPAAVELTAQGNLPAGAIARLVQRAKAGKRATRAQARRFGVSSELDLFYGDPQDDRPAGIYKRVVLPGGEHRLVPVIVFPRRSARYRPRFPFHAIARRKALAAFPGHLRQAWARAKATAR